MNVSSCTTFFDTTPMAYGAVWAARQVAKEACRTTFRRFLNDVRNQNQESSDRVIQSFSRKTSHFPITPEPVSQLVRC